MALTQLSKLVTTIEQKNQNYFFTGNCVKSTATIDISGLENCIPELAVYFHDFHAKV